MQNNSVSPPRSAGKARGNFLLIAEAIIIRKLIKNSKESLARKLCALDREFFNASLPFTDRSRSIRLLIPTPASSNEKFKDNYRIFQLFSSDVRALATFAQKQIKFDIPFVK